MKFIEDKMPLFIYLYEICIINSKNIFLVNYFLFIIIYYNNMYLLRIKLKIQL